MLLTEPWKKHLYKYPEPGDRTWISVNWKYGKKPKHARHEPAGKVWGNRYLAIAVLLTLLCKVIEEAPASESADLARHCISCLNRRFEKYTGRAG